MYDSLSGDRSEIADVCARIDRLIEAHDWTNTLLLELVTRMSTVPPPLDPYPGSRAPDDHDRTQPHTQHQENGRVHERGLGSLILDRHLDP
ncbi:MAG: hypothetical protein QOJ03_1449 [Frankiaceae bacterium]|nr:hypothetical protein [Frankiaceae bacterium]